MRLVVEEGVLRRLGHAASCVDVVARRRARRGRQVGWRPLEHDATLATLLGAGRGALVLARTPSADPGAACLAPLARAVGARVLRLPAHPDAAAWTVGVASGWAAGAERPDLERRIAALASAAAPGEDGGGLPSRPWGAAGVPVPALRPATLWRWAASAWRACAWCRGGGGLPAAPCARCGAAVPGSQETAPRISPLLSGGGSSSGNRP